MAKVKGLTIGIGADATKFNKEIKGMTKGVRDTQREVKTLAKSLELKWDSKRYVAAQKAAQSAIIQTDTKVNRLRERMKELDSVGTDKQSAHYRKVQNDLIQTETYAIRLKDELKKLNNLPIEQLAAKFDKVGSSISSAGQKLAPLSAAAAGILAGFAAIGASAISAGDDIGTTAQQINISTKALQKWHYIAQQTDVPMQQMTNGLKKIQVGLGALAAGENTDPIAMALEALGITTEDAANGMEGNFENIINSLAAMEDATLQAYYANEIFGAKMGANLIPMLNDGGEGLAALSAEFETFNYLTDEEVQSLDAFEDVLDKLKYSFATIKNQIGVALLPLMEQMAATIQDKIIPVVQKLADYFSSLTIEQQKMGLTILTIVSALAPLLLIIGKLTSGIGAGIKAIGALKGALTALAAHPIVLVIAIIIGLMALLYTKNEEFKASIDDLIGTLSSAFMPVLQLLGSVLQQLFAAIMPVVNILLEALAPILTMVAGTIGILLEALVPVIDLLVTALAPILDLIIGSIGLQVKVFGRLVSMLMTFLTPALNGIVQLISFLANKIQDFLIPIVNKIGDVFQDVFSAIPQFIVSVIDGIENMINGVIDMLNGLIKQVNKVGKFIGVELDTLSNIEIDVNVDEVSDTLAAIGGFITGEEPIGGFGDETMFPDGFTQNVEIGSVPFAMEDLDDSGAIQDVVGQSFVTDSSLLETNIDNSTKDISIDITIQNYGEEIDVDSLVEEINLKLVEAM